MKRAFVLLLFATLLVGLFSKAAFANDKGWQRVQHLHSILDDNAKAAKFTDAETMLKHFENQEKVRVIVCLKDPMEPSEKVDWDSKASKQRLKNRIKIMRDPVLKTLKKAGFEVKHVLSTMPAFSGLIDIDALDTLADIDIVESIEPARKLKLCLRQGTELINANPVRSLYSGSGVSIAICDTGIDYNHPNLGGGGFPNSKVIGGFDYGSGDADPFPSASHGTNCAGIAAGDFADVGDYVGGVAYNAKLYALKVSDSEGDIYNSAIYNAWDWCLDHKNDDPANPILVISNSLSGGYNTTLCETSKWSTWRKLASQLVGAGISIIASSGNDGYCNATGYPACMEDVISAGAVYDNSIGSATWSGVGTESCIYTSGSCTDSTTAADQVICYSNSASFLDFLAPSYRAYTTTIGTGYTSSFGGTSAASPYVAGAVACLQSAAKDMLGSFLTVAEVKAALANTGVLITDPKSGITTPRINLRGAIESIMPTSQPSDIRIEPALLDVLCKSEFVGGDESFTIYNDSLVELVVNNIDRPSGVILNPEPPYAIEPFGSQEVLVELVEGCGEGLGLLEVYSNDPDESPYPGGISLSISVRLRDLNGDGDVDIEDFAVLAGQWLEHACETTANCQKADLNTDGSVDLEDFGVFWQ